MEDYVKVYLEKFLYFCKKCNQGFHHKSNRSSHRNACPNTDGPDKYPGMLDIDPELEKNFVDAERFRKKMYQSRL